MVQNATIVIVGTSNRSLAFGHIHRCFACCAEPVPISLSIHILPASCPLLFGCPLHSLRLHPKGCSFSSKAQNLRPHSPLRMYRERRRPVPEFARCSQPWVGSLKERRPAPLSIQGAVFEPLCHRRVVPSARALDLDRNPCLKWWSGRQARAWVLQVCSLGA